MRHVPPSSPPLEALDAGVAGRAAKLVLFDVDGTLTAARKQAAPEVLQFLKDLRKRVTIGMVGGSDLKKQQEQLDPDVVHMFDYTFAENGLTAYKDGALIKQMSISKHLGDDNLKRVVNWVLDYFANKMADIPVKRGTFIECVRRRRRGGARAVSCARSRRRARERVRRSA